MIDSEVLTRVEGGLGRITLNRPKALHALNLGMCQAMTRALQDWCEDDTVRAVLIDHAGERGFCAGGDIRMLAESGAGDGTAAREFFLTEYRLNHLMFEYPKAITAVVDGVVMGGGVGISEPADVRVATERTTYAMPETGIGLFPDVGGSWFLPRLPGETGTWLALTGARLKAADTVALGVHTHFVPGERIEAFKVALARAPASPETIVAAHAADPGPAPLGPRRGLIDRCFAFDTVEAIVAALEDEGDDWAKTQVDILAGKSPQSLKITLRQLRLGRGMTDFAQAMRLEYALAGRVCASHDFQEGVRSVIVDKDGQPSWLPADLAGVTPQSLEAFFEPLPDDRAWSASPASDADDRRFTSRRSGVSLM